MTASGWPTRRRKSPPHDGAIFLTYKPKRKQSH